MFNMFQSDFQCLRTRGVDFKEFKVSLWWR